MTKFARCRCFLQSNVFLPTFGLHVTYRNDSQFIADYNNALSDMGCTDIYPVIKEIQKELSRRRNIPKDSHARKCYIKDHYSPLHPEIFKLKEDFFHSDFLEIVRKVKSGTLLPSDKLLDHHSNEVFIFNLFNERLCKMFVEELENFQTSNMPTGRPNSMNNYGVLLDELGFNDFLNSLCTLYLTPLCKLLFPTESRFGFDSYKAFTVHYEEHKDVELNFHYDNSEVTLNACFLADCEGGELYFGTGNSSKGFGYIHHLGKAVLHRGSAVHSVLPLTSGNRVNLVMWMRSSTVRNEKCPMCKCKPDLEIVEHGWGDGFTVDIDK